MKYVIILCLLFNVTKNLDRISEKKEQKQFWPVFKQIKYKTLKKNPIYINIPQNSAICGNIPFPCFVNLAKDIVIKKNYDYLIIIKKNE